MDYRRWRIIYAYMCLPLIMGWKSEAETFSAKFSRTLDGQQMNNNVIGEETGKTRIQCALECARDEACFSYTFRTTDGFCRRHDVPAIPNSPDFNTSPQPDTGHYDIDCFCNGMPNVTDHNMVVAEPLPIRCFFTVTLDCATGYYDPDSTTHTATCSRDGIWPPLIQTSTCLPCPNCTVPKPAPINLSALRNGFGHPCGMGARRFFFSCRQPNLTPLGGVTDFVCVTPVENGTADYWSSMHLEEADPPIVDFQSNNDEWKLRCDVPDVDHPRMVMLTLGDSGRIFSPNWPRPVKRSYRMVKFFFFVAPSDHLFEFTPDLPMLWMNAEGCDSALVPEYEGLALYDVTVSTESLIVRWCDNTTATGPVRSKTNVVVMVSTHNAGDRAYAYNRGFSVNYTVVAGPQSLDPSVPTDGPCGSLPLADRSMLENLASGAAGIMWSPNYPAFYGDMVTCAWTFALDLDTTISFRIEEPLYIDSYSTAQGLERDELLFYSFGKDELSHYMTDQDSVEELLPERCQNASQPYGTVLDEVNISHLPPSRVLTFTGADDQALMVFFRSDDVWNQCYSDKAPDGLYVRNVTNGTFGFQISFQVCSTGFWGQEDKGGGACGNPCSNCTTCDTFTGACPIPTP